MLTSFCHHLALLPCLPTEAMTLCELCKLTRESFEHMLTTNKNFLQVVRHAGSQVLLNLCAMCALDESHLSLSRGIFRSDAVCMFPSHLYAVTMHVENLREVQIAVAQGDDQDHALFWESYYFLDWNRIFEQERELRKRAEVC